MGHATSGGMAGNDRCLPWKHDWEFAENLTPKGKHVKPEEKTKFDWREKCSKCNATRKKSGPILRIGKPPGKK